MIARPDEIKHIDTATFDALKSQYVEVSSSAVGGRILSRSDEFFAAADNLLKPGPSVSMKGRFGPNGALYDGWESRRHNPSFDWVVIALGSAAHLAYVDIDTSHFKGNECPQAQVFGLPQATSTPVPSGLKPDDKRWEELLPVVTLSPDSRHIFELHQAAKDNTYAALMVRMIPDGGMARFRAFGRPVTPPLGSALPPSSTEPIDLLAPAIGGHIVSCSDANFSPASNLLLPGRGVDMSDGWETRRSQAGRGVYSPTGARAGLERREWVVARLGVTGSVSYVEVDTAFHPGNYPVAASVEGILSDDEEPSEEGWTPLVAKTQLGPHRQHWLASDYAGVISHVRMSIYPDGGLKRLRVFGHPLSPTADTTTPLPRLTALPLTPEAFAPYGDVIQAWEGDAAPRGVKVTPANNNTARKFSALAKVEHTYPREQLKRGGVALACMRAGPQYDVRHGADIPVTKLERHAATTQAFIPLGRREHAPGGTFVVVVALNGADDRPDMSTARAFLPTAGQGVSYHTGVWHHPMLTVNGWVDYACLDAQSGEEGLTVDCETVHREWGVIRVPPYDPVQAEAVPHSLPSGVDTTAPVLKAEAITHKAFAPYGELVRAFAKDEAPEGTVHGGNPALEITKLSWLSNLADTFPPGEGRTSVSVYRATPAPLEISMLERHPHTSQAFLPMGKDSWPGKGEAPLPAGGVVVVVVAESDASGERPDPVTLRAFVMPPDCGLNYKVGVWHHPLLVTAPMDLACVETQAGDERDCEVVEFGRVVARVEL